ncbi:siderophore ABC transporter substrate-binding protein [Paenibacillus caseinilyticus]|uniref:Iron ABC transporter substrate-binding protein n=1 Tax=Paenibacillus mucilaginosus K02 TaxID=997761 RepID=I0BV65_9BACL|nr:siderophore ABC transporter substrate-binding protein [Paenibacillus mucilaginosus]AFH66262.1 iron ABC transporter substrate-binding protein [Paenibacillus mucilaginosus K02]
MRKLSVLLLTLIIAVIASACGAAAPENNAAGSGSPAPEAAKAPVEQSFKHELGETKIKGVPSKVVVFDFGALDTLDRLGVEVLGVPQANIPSYLSKYKDAKYKNAGSLTEPDFEKISAMSPDLIIISGRQSKAYEELSKIAPTLYVALDTKNYMTSFENNTKTLAKIFGKEAAAEQELAKVNATVKAVKEKASASGKQALIILSNGGKVSGYGAGSRFGLIHDVLGFTPVDKSIEVTTHGQSISFEYIAEKNPDYLFVVDRDAVVGGQSNAKQTIENDLVKNTKAFKDGHIVYLDPNFWYLSGGGLISVEGMVKEVEASLK